MNIHAAATAIRSHRPPPPRLLDQHLRAVEAAMRVSIPQSVLDSALKAADAMPAAGVASARRPDPFLTGIADGIAEHLRAAAIRRLQTLLRTLEIRQENITDDAFAAMAEASDATAIFGQVRKLLPRPTIDRLERLIKHCNSSRENAEQAGYATGDVISVLTAVVDELKGLCS